MSDVEDEIDPNLAADEDFAHTPTADGSTDRSSKRRKIGSSKGDTEHNFPLLCNGLEPRSHALAREQALDELWARQQTRVHETISELDNDSLDSIVEYIQQQEPHTKEEDDRLTAGLVVSGSNIGVQARLNAHWGERRQSNGDILVELRSSSCSNLQMALKNIIRRSIKEVVGQDGYHEFLARHKRLVPMNFDLELLQTFAQDHQLSRIVVSILDVETFDAAVLSELISTLSSWSQRIPFIALIGIATTVELFEARLPRSSVGLLDAKIFTIPSSETTLYEIFDDIQTGLDSYLFFGPALMSTLNEIYQSQSTTVESFVRVIRYAYMSHFFANPLSVFLNLAHDGQKDMSLLSNIIRNTGSFQNYCENLLKEGQSWKVESLLDNDDTLLYDAETAITEGQEHFRIAASRAEALNDIYRQLNLKMKSPFEIGMQLYANLSNMANTTVFNDITAALESKSSLDLISFFDTVSWGGLDVLYVAETAVELQRFQELHPGQNFSSYLHTSRPAPPGASASEKEYNSLLSDFTTQLRVILKMTTFDLPTTFMHEAFILNTRQPLHNTFIPRPRFALERALDRPADYLGCECCSTNPNSTVIDPTLDPSRSQAPPPPTSILHKLLQEAGTTINVRDLFEAFSSRLADPITSTTSLPTYETDANNDNNVNDTSGGEARRHLSQFYASLSELKLLGLVKSSNAALTKKRALASTLADGGSLDAMDDGGRVGVGGGRAGKGDRYAEIDFVAKTGWSGL